MSRIISISEHFIIAEPSDSIKELEKELAKVDLEFGLEPIFTKFIKKRIYKDAVYTSLFIMQKPSVSDNILTKFMIYYGNLNLEEMPNFTRESHPSDHLINEIDYYLIRNRN